MTDLLSRLTKAAVCVYVATDEDSAKQISDLLTEAKNKIVALTQQVEELGKKKMTDTGNEIGKVGGQFEPPTKPAEIQPANFDDVPYRRRNPLPARSSR